MIQQGLPSFGKVKVPPLADVHYHSREDDDEDQVVGPLLEFAFAGGASLVGTMPNTKAGLLNSTSVLGYKKHCDEVGPGPEKLIILPFLQITPQTTREIIDECVANGILDAKVYPLNRTTKSQNGVRFYYEVLDIIVYACSKGMRVHFHPEHPMIMIENRDAEYLFLPIMDMIMEATKDLPGAIVWEHGTDARCIPFWEDWSKTGRFYVTITAHHLAASENETFGDVQATCKPPIKTRYDQSGLIGLVMKGYTWVMAGTDSAAHDKSGKHVLGQCACGAFTAPFAMALYAHVLRDLLCTPEGLKVFIAFTSGNAKKLYKIESLNTDKRTVTIHDNPMVIQDEYKVGTWTVESFWAGKELSCSVSWT